MSGIDKLAGLGPGTGSAFAQSEIVRAQGAVRKAEQVQKSIEEGGQASEADKAEISKAATQFESLLLHQMIKTMWATVPKEGVLSGSREEALYRDMLNQALADNIAEGQSIGIKDVIMGELDKK